MADAVIFVHLRRKRGRTVRAPLVDISDDEFVQEGVSAVFILTDLVNVDVNTSDRRIDEDGLPAAQKIHATAADVPIELYDLILSFLDQSVVGDTTSGVQVLRNKVTATKHEISQLGLVCRSWARMCQLKMFCWLKLRSGADFRDLLELAEHPCSRIAHYVERLELVASSQSTPWIHNVCM